MVSPSSKIRIFAYNFSAVERNRANVERVMYSSVVICLEDQNDRRAAAMAFKCAFARVWANEYEMRIKKIQNSR